MPTTAKRPVTDDVHGVKFTDDFRWLEGDQDPKNMGAMNDEVAKWTDAQNAYTRSILDRLSGRQAAEGRLTELMQMGTISAPQMAGSRYFYTKREGTQSQPIVYVRETFDGAARPLVDVNALDKSGLTALAWAEPSQDGKLLAFGTYRAGDENSTLFLMDVDTGVWLADEIPGKVEGVAWLPPKAGKGHAGNIGFFYQRLENLNDPYSAQIKYHTIGTHHSTDPVLFRQYTKEQNEKLATTWGPFLSVSKDARWATLGYWTTTKDHDLWVVNLEEWFRTHEFKRVDVLVGKEGKSSGPILRDTLYMLTTYNAPRGRVVKVDLKNPAEKNWTVIIPEPKQGTLDALALAKDTLVLTSSNNACSKIESFDLNGKSLGVVPLPGLGTASISVNDDRTEAFVSYESFNEPDSIYRIDLKAPKLSLWERATCPVDPSIAEVKRVDYKSKDGTTVGMFIVARKGLKLDGTNPTILYGYGGFGINMTPSFDPRIFPWIENGGVYAVANIRGGAENGEAWHEAGMLEKKQNVFDDFIAAGEFLISQKYTSSKHLGIYGGSNGGLLTGACVVQRPDLFGAVCSAVPLLDMMRFQSFLMARYWVGEYGSAEDAAQAKFIRAYSPYQNVKAGVKYPATLFTAGENDSRVHPLHARKMAAAMQAATANDQTKHPILLWVNRDAGHGQGMPLEKRVRQAADIHMFFAWQLGLVK